MPVSRIKRTDSDIILHDLTKLQRNPNLSLKSPQQSRRMILHLVASKVLKVTQCDLFRLNRERTFTSSYETEPKMRFLQTRLRLTFIILQAFSFFFFFFKSPPNPSCCRHVCRITAAESHCRTKFAKIFHVNSACGSYAYKTNKIMISGPDSSGGLSKNTSQKPTLGAVVKGGSTDDRETLEKQETT